MFSMAVSMQDCKEEIWKIHVLQGVLLSSLESTMDAWMPVGKASQAIPPPPPNPMNKSMSEWINNYINVSKNGTSHELTTTSYNSWIFNLYTLKYIM
jgi:hypothetical protein